MANTTLQLRRPNTIANSELLLGEILADTSGELDLRVPQSLKGDDLGGLAATLQTIATWARRNPRGRLRTYIVRSGLESGLRTLLDSEHGLFAILMAPAVVDAQGDDIVLEARHMAIQRLDQISSFNGARRGSQATIAAADHTSRNSPRALYASADSLVGSTLRKEAGMVQLVRQFSELTQVGAGSKRDLLYSAEPIAQILHELLDNTHRYARHGADGLTVIQPSVRLVRAEAIGQSLQLLTERAEDQPVLRKYLMHPSHRSALHSDSTVPDIRRFLEITVLDTGPGIAARRLLELGLSMEPTVESEFAALTDCLRKHVTTSSNASRGLGLEHVQSTLTRLRGFIRIRTGRIELTRDFVSSPYSPAEDQTSKWMPAADPRTSLRECTEGTVVTMLIPTNLYRES